MTAVSEHANSMTAVRKQACQERTQHTLNMTAVPDDTLTFTAVHEYTHHDSCEGTSQPRDGCLVTYKNESYS